MRGRGVDDTRGIVAVEQRHGLARGGVRQAQDGDIGLTQEIGAGGRVLAVRLGDRQDVEVTALRQPRPDLQSGGAVFAVDEDFRCHFRHSLE